MGGGFPFGAEHSWLTGVVGGSPQIYKHLREFTLCEIILFWQNLCLVESILVDGS